MIIHDSYAKVKHAAPVFAALANFIYNALQAPFTAFLRCFCSGKDI